MRSVKEIQARSRKAKLELDALMLTKRAANRSVGNKLLEVLILDWCLGEEAEHLSLCGDCQHKVREKRKRRAKSGLKLVEGKAK